MASDFRTLSLCRHDNARLRPISSDTYCRWLASKGYEKMHETQKVTWYDYVDPRGGEWEHEDLFFMVNKTKIPGHELINAEIVQLWAQWVPGKPEENLEIAIAELEALEATQ